MEWKVALRRKMVWNASGAPGKAWGRITGKQRPGGTAENSPVFQYRAQKIGSPLTCRYARQYVTAPHKMLP